MIGLTQPVAPVEFAPERSFKRPWVLKLAWVIGPKSPGVQFRDIGLEIRPMIGDSVYAITDEVAGALIERLQGMDDLSAAELTRIQTKYAMFA